MEVFNLLVSINMCVGPRWRGSGGQIFDRRTSLQKSQYEDAAATSGNLMKADSVTHRENILDSSTSYGSKDK